MKTIIHNIYNTLLLVVISWSVSFAQTAKPTGKISGTLVNEQNKPLGYANVSLLQAADSSTVKGTLSNDAGIYNFTNVKAGNYLIKATNIGYEKAISAPIKVTDGANLVTVPLLNMHPGSTALKAVSITTTRPLIERKIDRTVMNVENSVLAAGNNAMEILEKAPGVTVDKDDNISLNGKQGVTVMINDKLTYLSAEQLATLLRSTDGGTIKSIELITNPSAKYDAAGNSGIINIKLKKNTQSGTNGSLTVGAARGQNWRDNTSLNINHKEGKLNVFANLSRGDGKHGHDLYINRAIKDSVKNSTTYFNQVTHMPSTFHYNDYRLGADYDLTNKHTIGFVVSGYSNTGQDNNNSQTIIGKKFGGLDSSLITNSNINQSYKNFALNLNDRLKIDTSGQELSIDLDYSKFNNNSIAQYYTDYFVPDNNSELQKQHAPLNLRNQTPSAITIYTGKADYTKPLSKTLKLEAGVKFSNVKTDNNLHAQKQDSVSMQYLNDTTRTNHFIYDEKIDAAYFNINKQFKKTSVQVGLRAEYTQSNGNLIGSAPVNRHYLNLFPSVFINQTLSAKNEISLSYSRRIDRPSYDDLNPFIYYLDPYTYGQGNAFLNPQYTQNFEFNYTYNHSLNISLSYSHTTDAITQVILTQGNKSFQTNKNLRIQDSYNVNTNLPITITKWWSANLTLNSFYLNYKADTISGQNLKNGKVAVYSRLTQTLTFGNYKAEITGHYQSPFTYGIFDLRPQYGIDAGISRSFADKKVNVKLACDDIFKMSRNDLSSHQAGNDSRVLRLTLTYNFGNSAIKSRDHQGGADAEKNRVRGGN